MTAAPQRQVFNGFYKIRDNGQCRSRGIHNCTAWHKRYRHRICRRPTHSQSLFFNMILSYIFGLLVATSSLAKAVNITGYKYVIVGSGASSGPLATHLALAGYKTLLLEASNDQGENFNYTIPTYSTRASKDKKLSWNFFVHHYEDEER